MIDNPYKDLPPLERRPDGSLYRMDTGAEKTGGQPDTPGVLLL